MHPKSIETSSNLSWMILLAHKLGARLLLEGRRRGLLDLDRKLEQTINKIDHDVLSFTPFAPNPSTHANAHPPNRAEHPRDTTRHCLRFSTKPKHFRITRLAMDHTFFYSPPEIRRRTVSPAPVGSIIRAEYAAIPICVCLSHRRPFVRAIRASPR